MNIRFDVKKNYGLFSLFFWAVMLLGSLGSLAGCLLIKAQVALLVIFGIAVIITLLFLIETIKDIAHRITEVRFDDGGVTYAKDGAQRRWTWNEMTRCRIAYAYGDRQRIWKIFNGWYFFREKECLTFTLRYFKLQTTARGKEYDAAVDAAVEEIKKHIVCPVEDEKKMSAERPY